MSVRTLNFLTSATSASSPASITASSSAAASSSSTAAPSAILLLLVHLLWLGDLQLTLRTRQQPNTRDHRVHRPSAGGKETSVKHSTLVSKCLPIKRLHVNIEGRSSLPSAEKLHRLKYLPIAVVTLQTTHLVKVKR